MASLISKGLVIIGGAANVGKSICAANIVPPAELDTVVVHDGERSMEEFRAKANALKVNDRMVDFGSFVDLENQFGVDTDEILARTIRGKFPWKNDREQGAMESYFTRTAEAIQELEPGRHSIYIHEPADKLEAAIYAYAVRHSGVPLNSRDVNFWNTAMYPVYEGLFNILRSKGIEVIVLTAHLKSSSVRRGNKTVVIPNKLEMAVKPRLYKNSALMMILVQEPANAEGEPAGLVIKERLPSVGIDEKGNWVIRRMLPRRIPVCVWRNGEGERSSIEWYLKNGADLKNPHESELWSDFEKETFGEFLNRTQMRMMVAMDEADLASTRGSSPVFDMAKERRRGEIKTEMESGLSLDEAIKKLVDAVPSPLRAKTEKDLREAME